MVSPHKEELTALAKDMYYTLLREDAERSFKKTGQAVVITTAQKVNFDKIMESTPKLQKNKIMGVHPMKFIKQQEEVKK